MSAAPTPSIAPVPAPLAEGAVRGRHILFLYVLIFGTAAIVGTRLARSVDPQFSDAWQSVVAQSMSALLVVGLILIVPEMRRALPTLYSRRSPSLEPLDALLFTALMLSWAFGASQMLVSFPLLQWRPDLYETFGYRQHLPEVGAQYLFLAILARCVIAPFAEELLFRGYLLNLWRRRWGLWPGVLLSSLAFGVAHLQFMVFAMVAGIFLALVYLRFGSLWPGTLLHALCNFIGFQLSLTPFFLLKSPTQLAFLASWIPEIMLSLAFFPLLMVFWRRFRPVA